MSDTTNTNSPATKSARTDKQTGKRVLTDTTQPKVAAITRRKLGPDESLTRKEKEMHVDVAKKTVTTTYTFKLNEKSDDVWVVTSVFDYNHCSMDEILQLATASARISAQSLLRKMPNNLQLNDKTFATIDVKSQIIDTVRTPVDADTRAIRSFATASGITIEEATKLLNDVKSRKSA